MIRSAFSYLSISYKCLRQGVQVAQICSELPMLLLAKSWRIRNGLQVVHALIMSKHGTPVPAKHTGRGVHGVLQLWLLSLLICSSLWDLKEVGDNRSLGVIASKHQWMDHPKRSKFPLDCIIDPIYCCSCLLISPKESGSVGCSCRR